MQAQLEQDGFRRKPTWVRTRRRNTRVLARPRVRRVGSGPAMRCNDADRRPSFWRWTYDGQTKATSRLGSSTFFREPDLKNCRFNGGSVTALVVGLRSSRQRLRLRRSEPAYGYGDPGVRVSRRLVLSLRHAWQRSRRHVPYGVTCRWGGGSARARAPPSRSVKCRCPVSTCRSTLSCGRGGR